MSGQSTLPALSWLWPDNDSVRWNYSYIAHREGWKWEEMGCLRPSPWEFMSEVRFSQGSPDSIKPTKLQNLYQLWELYWLWIMQQRAWATPLCSKVSHHQPFLFRSLLRSSSKKVHQGIFSFLPPSASTSSTLTFQELLFCQALGV